MATTLAQSLLAFQAEGIEIPKTQQNDHLKYRYAGLDSVMSTVLPVANKNGLVVMQLPCQVDGVPSLTTRIVHAESGESVESTMPLSIVKPDPQTYGAALTYARRYGLMSMLGLVADEDTDGHEPIRSAKGKAEPARRAPAEEAQPGAAAPATGTKRDPKYATEKQTGMLWAICTKHGITEDTLRNIIERETGQRSGAEIPKTRFEAVLAAVRIEAGITE